MSLRTQIRDAVDEVSPPVHDLEQRVTAYVLAGNTQSKVRRMRPGGSRRTYRFRGLGAAVAAALVIALVAGLILGGRLLRDLNTTPATINPTELKSLERRAPNFPSVAPGAQCPVTSLLNPNGGNEVGTGPVQAVDGHGLEANDWGTFGRLLLIYDAPAAGLVLVRARDLQSDREVAFAQYPLEPTGVVAVGPVLGTVHALNRDLRLRSEAVFRDSWSTPRVGDGPNLLLLVAVQKGSSRCIGFQFDGPGFTENFVVAPALYLNV